MSERGENGAGGGGPRVAFRQEGDRLLLTAPGFHVGFSLAAKGSLVSLWDVRHERELVFAPEAEEEAELWQIGLLSGAGARVTLSNRGSERCVPQVVTDGTGAIRLSFTWSELRIGEAHLPGEVTAHFTLPRDGRNLLAELSFSLPEGLSVERVEFPRVTALGMAEPSKEESVFLPQGEGLLIPDPRTLLGQMQKPIWELEYPGPASMQLLGYTSGPSMVALSARDISGACKSLVISRAGHSHRLGLWLQHEPVADAEGQWTLGYPCALTAGAGDWHEATKEYRRWAIHQPWCVRGTPREHVQPALTAYQGLWLTHWGGGRMGNEAARALLRHMNAPVRLDWRQWHGDPYPDCFPARDGDTSFNLGLAGYGRLRGVRTALAGRATGEHSVRLVGSGRLEARG